MSPLIPENAHSITIPGYSERVGKVRHTYELDNEHLLMVASDRVSTFDVVHPTAIPDKGKVLTAISAFWFSMAEQLGIPHHLITADTDEIIERYPELKTNRDQIEHRSMLVHKGAVPPLEAIVRGNITGSGWKEYQQNGTVCGIELPANLQQCEELHPPIFTPSTKAEEGHDVNISYEQACEIVDGKIVDEIREKSLLLFSHAREYAKKSGIIIADTKFEFAQTEDGLLLADEVLTPDSSRFWPVETFGVGRDQPSLDKQYVRNYVSGLGWNKEYPAPEIPHEVVQVTRNKYLSAYQRLTGTMLKT